LLSQVSGDSVVLERGGDDVDGDAVGDIGVGVVCFVPVSWLLVQISVN
jgi:hypothetical protein